MRIAFVAIFLLLTACGGGGDDANSGRYLLIGGNNQVMAEVLTDDCAGMSAQLAFLRNMNYTLSCQPDKSSTALPWSGAIVYSSTTIAYLSPTEAACRQLQMSINGTVVKTCAAR